MASRSVSIWRRPSRSASVRADVSAWTTRPAVRLATGGSGPQAAVGPAATRLRTTVPSALGTAMMTVDAWFAQRPADRVSGAQHGDTRRRLRWQGGRNSATGSSGRGCAEQSTSCARQASADDDHAGQVGAVGSQRVLIGQTPGLPDAAQQHSQDRLNDAGRQWDRPR